MHLLARRDGPGLLRLGVQGLLLAVCGLAAIRLAAAGHASWPAATALTGVWIATFFPALHEAGHRTAFRSRTWNELTVWLGALLMLQSPSFFRAFHFEHHRRTQDPEHDPEIAAAPGILDDWPRNPLVYLGLACGQPLMLGKLGFTLGGALLPARAWERVFPFVPAGSRRRIAWESRAVLGVLGGGAALGLATAPGFAALLLAWPVAHVLLGLYLMAEHTGLPYRGSQLERTRTVASNALVRWLMWNMPYHAEHHAQPGVPFHAVPVLHRRLAPQLVHTAPGYLAFHRQALRHAFGLAAARDSR